MKRIFFAALALVSIAASAATLAPVQLINPAESTSGQAIVSTGASSAPAWANISLAGIGAIAANTVVANFTGSSASPIAFSMPSCTGATNALGYTSGTGFVCNSSINAAMLGGQTFASPTITTPWITGVTNGSPASAGQVGQLLTASGSSVSITNSTSVNCASLSLPAGDWNVWGNVNFAPAGGAQFTVVSSGFSTTSATLPAVPNLSQTVYPGSTTFGQSSMPPMQVENVSVGTTVYLVGNAGFASGTATMSCFINARRVH